MKADIWRALLEQLTSATRQGRATWTRGDLPGTFVLARKGGSVAVRRYPDLAIGHQLAVIQVRDTEGQVVDELPVAPVATTGVRLASAAAGVLSIPDELDDLDVAQLQDPASALLEAIAASRKRGEEVALRIIEDLGDR